MPRQANALEILRHDHREVQQLFHRFEKASGKEQDKLCDDMVKALKTHTRIEEEVFYPYIRQATDCIDLVEEANVEHGTAKQLIADLESGHDGVHRHAVVKVLSEYVGHHIREEEDKIFPLVEKTGVDLQALGEELMAHKKGEKGDVMGSSKEGPAEKASTEKGGGGFAAQAHSREEDEAYREAVGDELGRSARRAQWIYSPNEREDHEGQTLVTRNPAVIRAWAEERKAKPATSPGGDPQNPRVLRFDFPDYDKNLQELSWEAWFNTFESRGLVFLFQQHMKSGKQSNFFRLESPSREDA